MEKRVHLAIKVTLRSSEMAPQDCLITTLEMMTTMKTLEKKLKGRQLWNTMILMKMVKVKNLLATIPLPQREAKFRS